VSSHTANTLTVTSLQGAVDRTRAGVARRARGAGHQQGRGRCQSNLQPSYYKGICGPENGEILGQVGGDPGNAAGAEDPLLETADDGPGEARHELGGAGRVSRIYTHT